MYLQNGISKKKKRYCTYYLTGIQLYCRNTEKSFN